MIHVLRVLTTCLALTAGLVFSGCATSSGSLPPQSSQPKDPLSLPSSMPLGSVIRVDPEAEIALVEVESSSTRVAPILVSRNQSLAQTAILEPTRFRSGRILGAKILSGLPNVGDEVIAEPPPATPSP